jgi:hypothetical protein
MIIIINRILPAKLRSGCDQCTADISANISIGSGGGGGGGYSVTDTYTKSEIDSFLNNKVGSICYTDYCVFNKAKRCDGSGSGFDSDLLDGLHASSFALLSEVSGGTPTWGNISGTLANQSDLYDELTGHSHSSYSLTGHTHTLYAPIGHGHTQYELTGHTHTQYSATGHTHTLYAPIGHGHTQYELTGHSHSSYSLTGHTHTLYAPIGHGHTQYELTGHTHTLYAPIGHGHTQYELTGHTHSIYAPLASPSFTTCICTPVMCSTGVVKGTIVSGSTCGVSPVLFGSTCVNSPLHCGAIVKGTTCVCSPIIIGSTCSCSPVILGSTCVCSPIVLGSTCVCSPILCAGTSVSAPIFYATTVNTIAMCGCCFRAVTNGFASCNCAVVCVIGNCCCNSCALAVYTTQSNAADFGVRAALFDMTVGYMSTTKFQQFMVGGVNDGTISSVSGCLQFTQESDCRKKTNIQPAATDSLSLINALEVKQYCWCHKYQGQKQIGLVAQEVVKVMPELVDRSDPENYAIGYERMHSHYIRAIQQLTDCIKKLESGMKT